ncbi:MAG: MBL fold metallo-hydrolase [Brevinema sp.]
MILEQLSDKVFYLPHNSHLDRPTLGYIRGNHFSVMIDCGNSKSHLELFIKGVKERNLPYPKFAIISHWHWDHTFGMHAFNGSIIANNKTANRLSKMKQWIWSDKAMKERLSSGEEIEFCDRYIRLEYPDLSQIQITTPDIIFEDHLTVDLGGIHCEIKLVAWPHAVDSNLIYIPDERIYFVGDADSEDFYHNNGKYEETSLQQIINFWKEQDFSWHIHGHIKPQTKKEVLEWLHGELDLL